MSVRSMRAEMAALRNVVGVVLWLGLMAGGCGEDAEKPADSGKGGEGAACIYDEDCEKGLSCVLKGNTSACGTATATDGGGVDGGTSGGGDVQAEDTYVPVPDEDFWVLYGRRLRNGLTLKPGESENDVVLTHRKNPQALTNSSTFGLGVDPFDTKKPAIELTQHSFKSAGGLTCNYGCIISETMQNIAVAMGDPGVGGYTYQLGLLNQDLQVNIAKFGQLKNVADLHFAGGQLFYSTPRNCFGTGKCQYEIRRLNVSNVPGVPAAATLTVMAPDSDPDVLSNPKHSTYTGRFQVSADGSTLVFLTTTIRSVKVYAWRAGNVHKLDYICENPLDNETCVGTGSQYHDNDKVGISPDGTEVVLFTIVQNNLRVRKYQVKGEQAPTFSNVVTTPQGQPYLKSVCLNLAKWQHAEVRGKPVYSADGKRLYFLGHSECAGKSEKQWTDIMSLPVAKIGGKLTEADFINYTNNPREQSSENLFIRDFTLSPEKHYFVFNAAPRFSSTGDPISDSDVRQIKDTEIYTMGAQVGETPEMITNMGRYECQTPFAVKPLNK